MSKSIISPLLLASPSRTQ